MSVAWNSCSYCGRTFSDCGGNPKCNEEGGGCGRKWCSKECAKADGHIKEYCKLGRKVVQGYPESEEHKCDLALKDRSGYLSCEECECYVSESCSYCRNEAFEDSELLEYALQGLKMTKEELIECLKEDKKINTMKNQF